jgi:allantoinase
MFIRGVNAPTYAATLAEATEVLCRDGRAGAGRVLGVHLHPWVAGQAFRAAAIAPVLGRIRDDERVWMATPGEVVQWCRGAR